MKLKSILKYVCALGMSLFLLVAFSCRDTKKKEAETVIEETKAPFFKLSLAQWSINKMIRQDSVDPYTFAEKAKNWGFDGLEYVSQLYYPELEAANFSDEAMAAFVEKSNAEAKKYGLKNILIMIDRQGDLATSDPIERKKAVENHYKWVDAAAAMGCHSIRVNLSGNNDVEEWIPNSVNGLTQLATYAKGKNINVIVENHGGLSSKGNLLAEVMEKVGMDNCGTLPDFGNFCVKMERKDDKWECTDMYDIYKGVEELMPYAKGVSAKAYNFDEDGNETRMDYPRILQIVKDAGYNGYIGVEYEGWDLGEEEGILATKELLLNAVTKLN